MAIIFFLSLRLVFIMGTKRSADRKVNWRSDTNFKSAQGPLARREIFAVVDLRPHLKVVSLRYFTVLSAELFVPIKPALGRVLWEQSSVDTKVK